MKIVDTIAFAISSILINRLRSLLTILGIVIGVTSVILLISLVSGLKGFVTSQIEGLGSNLIFVVPGRIGGSRSPGGVQANRIVLSDALTLKSSLGSNAEVSGVLQRNATIKRGNKSDKNVAVFGVQGNYNKIITLNITSGRFFTNSEAESGKKVVVIGASVVKNLFYDASPAKKTIAIAGLKYEVIGTVGVRGSTFGIDQDNAVFIPLAAAQKQFGIANLNTIYVSANKSEDVETVQERISKILDKRLSEDEFTVLTQEQALSTVSQITTALTIGLGGIAAISLVVGGIGVMNIMLVSVTERTKEIGLRKALGAKPKDIKNQFLIEAVTLSIIGGVSGIFLGFILSFALNHFVQTTLTWWSVVLSFSFSMLVGIIFGVGPAIRAAKLDPITALRYE